MKPLSRCAVALFGVLSVFSISSQASDFSINVGAITVMPDDSSGHLNVVEQVAGMPTNSTGAVVNTNTQLGLSVDYRVAPHWQLSLIAATPFAHDIHGSGSLAGMSIGRTKQLPPTLLVQYHFNDDNAEFNPFVGVGVNYTTFFDEKVDDQLGSALVGMGAMQATDNAELALSSSWGLAFQAGINWQLSQQWGVHAMVSKIAIDTDADVRINGTTVDSIKVDIDPYVAMLGLRYRF
ncbi:OmpW/AlkL family protein [Idiomarina xiamenensis]|uniref:Outer membrane protein OmpW n=1 Tax=Idiomarina xiamenensis 10-D-4 TaxID=740709 RepID=K2JMH5_9GAMM|nr:OmpW family outer membrane protein [Idiomarina xiamenensis]EKE84701.1 Outer membrane protein OmpW [Idiomarina xiamenensis 10-D-4]